MSNMERENELSALRKDYDSFKDQYIQEQREYNLLMEQVARTRAEGGEIDQETKRKLEKTPARIQEEQRRLGVINRIKELNGGKDLHQDGFTSAGQNEVPFGYPNTYGVSYGQAPVGGQFGQSADPPPPYSTTTTTTTVTATTSPPTTTTVIVHSTGFGEYPLQVVCPHCHIQCITETTLKAGTLTWLVCFGCCILFGIFSLIAFCIDSLQDVEHRCSNCKNLLGVYQRM